MLRPLFSLFNMLFRLLRSKVMRMLFLLLALACIFVIVWFGLPMLGWAPLVGTFPRVLLIVLIVGSIIVYYGFPWYRRRRQAKALEESLLPPPIGDGSLLNERMTEALEKLKKVGGRNYLYDLPWYVIIGPPGAGKTTALANSGIKFPDMNSMRESSKGFGGTRNCDWWFAEDAVLIDTAGRYTTQDSDGEADKASWTSFLEMLKAGRADQPINGVLLAFSVEDMMNASEESLAAHAKTVRTRLAEIHEILKIDFPVYVLFTKADLIAGFREYFGSFSQSRRKLVWGTTFDTPDHKAETWKMVGTRFDELVSRLSDEVIDRMNEEPDAISRIAIFGLPGQMAMLRNNVEDFLRRVFEPTRYATNAILRGFYFTSGTQEGTPIDQVLGAMSRSGGNGAVAAGFTSGLGKSYFLHDVLKRVIFEERDWVGFDRQAVRRRTLRRVGMLALIGGVTLLGATGLSFSYWHNSALLRAAEVDAARYQDTARNELERPLIIDPDLSFVVSHLQDLRQMTAGYGDPRRPPFWSGMGLSRYKETNLAATKAYSDGLEQILRPRMILEMENSLPQLIVDGDTAGVYRALKVYLLLGASGDTVGPEQDAAITAYFEDLWSEQFYAPGQYDDRDRLLAHLQAMLELDGDRVPLVSIAPELITRAREAIINLPLAEQAWASIKDRSSTVGLPEFKLAEVLSGTGAEILRMADGSSLEHTTIPGLFTFEGYWGYFLEEQATARERLREDQWVLGEIATRIGYETQLTNLEHELHRFYRLEFNNAWSTMLSQLSLGRMSADAPQYEILGSAGSQVASPILTLVEVVDRETRLTRLYDELDGMSPEQLAAGGDASEELASDLGDTAFQRIYARSGVFQRVIMDSLRGRTKDQERVGNDQRYEREQAERIAADFEQWHMLLKGELNARPIDLILANIRTLRETRRQAVMVPTPADETMLSQALSALTMHNTALPEPLSKMLNKVDGEFRSMAQDATMAQLNRALNDEVTSFCRDFVAPMYPFGNGRHISPSVFGQFFGPGGRMDSFYTSYLQPHVMRGSNGLEPVPTSPIGSRISPVTLRHFDRAQSIRMAFFATGSAEPEISMTLTHVTSSPSVDLAVLTVNGASIRTQPRSSPANMSWPGQGSGVSLEFYPQEEGRQSLLSLTEGRWDIVSLLRRSRARISGTAADVTIEVGGRSITYRFEFDSTTVPFLMPELSDFSCPTSLE